MALEVTGLAVSGVALCGLFNTCLKFFETVTAGKSYGAAYQVLMCKLEVEQVLLMRWGEAVGLFNLPNSIHRNRYDGLLNDELILSVVFKTLSCLKTMFENAGDLATRYGLHPLSADEAYSNQTTIGHKPTFERTHEKLQLLRRQTQDEASFSQKTRWAIHDRGKFELLISDIRGFNESLSRLFPDVGRIQQQQAKAEIAKSTDIEALRILVDASKGTHDLISDAASIRVTNLTEIGTQDYVAEWVERTNQVSDDNHTNRLKALNKILDWIRSATHVRRPSLVSHQPVNTTASTLTPPSHMLDSKGLSPLHWAIWSGKAQEVRRLVEGGADINLADADGWTPLIHAVCYNNLPIVRILVDLGADIDLADSHGYTPLYWASFFMPRCREVSELLTQKGAHMSESSLGESKI